MLTIEEVKEMMADPMQSGAIPGRAHEAITGLLYQNEIAVVALAKIYDTVGRMIAKYQETQVVLDDIELFREIAGAAMHEIYHPPNLAPSNQKEAEHDDRNTN